jgi:hypothetical protein
LGNGGIEKEHQIPDPYYKGGVQEPASELTVLEGSFLYDNPCQDPENAVHDPGEKHDGAHQDYADKHTLGNVENQVHGKEHIAHGLGKEGQEVQPGNAFFETDCVTHLKSSMLLFCELYN